MKTIRELEPTALWNIFADICAIPHASGNEKNLARHLRAFAKDHGLKAVIENTGNLWIERPAAAGFEDAPTVILQAHMDMVPQKRPDVVFDFAVDPIVPVVEGGRVTTGGQTTLGADNGIGMAAALALALDEKLVCGKIKILFTREEETGLAGAMAAKADHFNAEYLINLDSEQEDCVFVGCAGGAHHDVRLNVSLAAAKPGLGVKISLTDLKGGHSGEDIGKNRGNAITMLSEFLLAHPEFQIVSLHGGGIRNAIAREAEAVGVIDTALPGQLRRAALEQLTLWMQRYDIGSGARFHFELVDSAERVWSSMCREKLLQAVVNLPQGVLKKNESGFVIQSNNIGIIESDEKYLRMFSHPRANHDEDLKMLLTDLTRYVNALGGRSSASDSYPAWECQGTGTLFDVTNAASQRLFKRKLKASIMHAGIECGIFTTKNPKLEMISLGPVNKLIHSPNEYVEIDSVGRFYKLLHTVLGDLGRLSHGA